MDIIGLGLSLVEAVAALAGRARYFYYSVMLAGHVCPACGGNVSMVAEGRSRCRSCGHELDPTLAFQRCSSCGGKPELRVRRYRCRGCGADVASRFLFDGLVFDTEYFRQKMVEHRQKKKEQTERVRKMLAESRSPVLEMSGATDLTAVPGLVEALNGLTSGPAAGIVFQRGSDFDLERHESHLEAHIHEFPVSLDEIPSLGEDGRKERIWRFVAAIFLAHAAQIDIWQEGETIMVMKHETNGEGQDIPGDLEEADGFRGSLGGIEA